MTIWHCESRTPYDQRVTLTVDEDDAELAAHTAADELQGKPFSLPLGFGVMVYQHRTAPTHHRDTRATGYLHVKEDGSFQWDQYL